MQGSVLSARGESNLILGDDGVRYTFTSDEWRGDTAPEVGTRVDFEVRGSDAVDVYPIPDSAPQHVTATAGATAPKTTTKPSRNPWLLIGGVAAVVLVIIAASFALGLFSSSSPPIGKEIARHNHEGKVYVLVEYGDELAIFTASGVPVTQRRTADDVLRSYAWRQALSDFDASKLVQISRRVDTIDDSVSGVRSLSNDVVDVFDELDDLEADIPFFGSVSAMDVIAESFAGVGEAESVIRSLDSELNDLGDNAAALSNAANRIPNLNLTSVSGDEMDRLFGGAASAADDLASTTRSIEEGVSDARQPVARLESALRSASDTPIIGSAIRDSARTVGRFESQLSDLSDVLEGFEADLAEAADDMKTAIASADNIQKADIERWLEAPYDTQWPPEDPERRSDRVADPAISQPPTSTASPIEIVEIETIKEVPVTVLVEKEVTVEVEKVVEKEAPATVLVEREVIVEVEKVVEVQATVLVEVAKEVTITSVAPNPTPTPEPTATAEPTPTPEPSPTPEPTTAQSTNDHQGRIAFVSDRDGDQEIYVMNADGTGVVQLTDNFAQVEDPAWSPDGRRIAFSSNRDSAHGNSYEIDHEIYVMNADGTGVVQLTDNSDGDGRPAWSPDGRRIAFNSNRDGDREIYVMNADGRSVVQLTDNSGFAGSGTWSPAGSGTWSPDGRRIAFFSDRDGDTEIYVMNADGTGVVQITHNSDADAAPAWSPDGRRIAFVSDRDGDWEIYVMNADGTGVVQLTDISDGNGMPAWSPDGRRIAFISYRDGDWEIYVMNADGTGVVQLTHNSDRDVRPAWSPASR